MAKKTAQHLNKSPPSREQIVEAALDIAARESWDAVTWPKLAQESGADLAALRACFTDKSDLLAAFHEMIDQRVLAAAGDNAGLSPRDRLFDLMMERLEALNEHRTGTLAIIEGLKRDPGALLYRTKHLAQSMRWMLEAAAIDLSGPGGALRVMGMTALYLEALRHWTKDDSPDLSATMAVLDKNLRIAEQWVSRLPF